MERSRFRTGFEARHPRRARQSRDDAGRGPDLGQHAHVLRIASQAGTGTRTRRDLTQRIATAFRRRRNQRTRRQSTTPRRLRNRTGLLTAMGRSKSERLDRQAAVSAVWNRVIVAPAAMIQIIGSGNRADRRDGGHSHDAAQPGWSRWEESGQKLLGARSPVSGRTCGPRKPSRDTQNAAARAVDARWSLWRRFYADPGNAENPCTGSF